jgi:hypothetical protein
MSKDGDYDIICCGPRGQVDFWLWLTTFLDFYRPVLVDPLEVPSLALGPFQSYFTPQIYAGVCCATSATGHVAFDLASQ